MPFDHPSSPTTSRMTKGQTHPPPPPSRPSKSDPTGPIMAGIDRGVCGMSGSQKGQGKWALLDPGPCEQHFTGAPIGHLWLPHYLPCEG